MTIPFRVSMNLVYLLEQRFAITSDGSAWTRTGYPRPYWDRYLAVFDEVTVVARAQAVSEKPSGWREVTGKRVRFAPIPYYVGPVQYLKVRSAVAGAIRSALPRDSAVILRSPGPLAFQAADHLISIGHSYGAEVVGDPLDVFAPGASSSPLRLYLRSAFARAQRRLCQHADAVAYVTLDALQRRYPTSAMSFGVSDVELPEEAFARGPRVFSDRRGPLKLLSIGSLETPYKGVDVLLRALHQARGSYSLKVVGEGRQRPALEKLAQYLELSPIVSFHNEVPAGEAVRAYLDEADMLVMPSRTEGLPRIMLEAMARGLPCIGSRVGGIPELLGSDFLVQPGDVAGLAEILDNLSSHPNRLSAASIANLETAYQHRDTALQPMRAEFFRAVAQAMGE